MLNCPLCAKVLSDSRDLNTHLMSHTKEKPCKCPTCSAVFGLPVTLKKHIKVIHEGVKPKTYIQEKNWKCSFCTYNCSSKSTLNRHLGKHSTELPFSCTVPDCDFKAKWKLSVPLHVQRMHSDDGRPHECTSKGCNYKTNSRSNLRRHLKIHSKDKPFVCQHQGCNFTSKYNSSLQSHTFARHSKDKPLKCSICDFRTKYKLRLRQHEDEHNNIQRFPCQVSKCSFATNSNQRLQLHVGRKHMKKNVKCTAPGCIFRCGTSALLKIHVQSKHVAPILKCPDNSCSFSTRVPWDLRLHVSRQHEEFEIASLLAPGRSNIMSLEQTEAMDTLICPLNNCDYQTEFQHRYDVHLKTHQEEKRKHACKFCSYRCTTHAGLLPHIRKHVGEKIYSCSHCEYTTVHGGALRGHAGKIHQIHMISRGPGNKGLREWNCQTCSKNCASNNELVLHSLVHLKVVVVLERLKLEGT